MYVHVGTYASSSYMLASQLYAMQGSITIFLPSEKK